MSHPTITPLPTPPSRGDSPDDFSSKADALLGALPTFVTQENALAAYIDLKAIGLEQYQGEWSAAITYSRGQSVSYTGNTAWASKVNSNLNNAPVAGVNWLLLDQNLRTELASTAAGKGAALLGYKATGASTVALTVDAKLKRQARNLRDWGAVCDATSATNGTDDYAAWVAALTDLNDGDELIIDGFTVTKSPIVLTKRIDITCLGENSGLVLQLNNTQIGITSPIPAAASKKVKWNLQVLGGANCCLDAVSLNFANDSDFRISVIAGAARAGISVNGCLVSRIQYDTSTNRISPLAGCALPFNGLILSSFTQAPFGLVPTNACKFDFNISGTLGTAVLSADLSGQGDNEFTGTIQCNAKAFDLTGCTHVNIRDMHLESSTAPPSTFTNCSKLEVSNVLNVSGAAVKGFNFVGCTNIDVDNYTGSLNFDSTCTGRVGAVLLNAGDSIVNTGTGMQQTGLVNLTSSAIYSSGAIGQFPLENLFHNPYTDIYSAGVAAAADGFASTGTLTFAKEVGTSYPGNPRGVSLYANFTAAPSIAQGVAATTRIPNAVLNEAGWISVMTAVYVAAGQADVAVNLFDGISYYPLKIVTERDQWAVIRGSVKMPAGQGLQVFYVPAAAKAFVIGGLSIVRGNIAPRFLSDDGKRNAYVVTNVGFAPAFVGQFALVAGVPYFAKATTANTDWVAI